MSAVMNAPTNPVLRLLAREFLRFEIDSAERWVQACKDDGILESETLTRIRADIAEKRVRLALLEPAGRPYIPLGCDQQGRRPDRAPAPAEASTEIGADMPGRRVPEAEAAGNFVVGLVAVVAVIAAAVHIGARLF